MMVSNSTSLRLGGAAAPTAQGDACAPSCSTLVMGVRTTQSLMSKPLKPAAIEEMFRRFAAKLPDPKGELEYRNPFTLLVAVVLSAQATDKGVNRATPALFDLADTPAKMAALGEAKIRDLIKTIGLYRGKAKNVAALSGRLVNEFHG